MSQIKTRKLRSAESRYLKNVADRNLNYGDACNLLNFDGFDTVFEDESFPPSTKISRKYFRTVDEAKAYLKADGFKYKGRFKMDSYLSYVYKKSRLTVTIDMDYLYSPEHNEFGTFFTINS